MHRLMAGVSLSAAAAAAAASDDEVKKMFGREEGARYAGFPNRTSAQKGMGPIITSNFRADRQKKGSQRIEKWGTSCKVWISLAGRRTYGGPPVPMRSLVCNFSA